MLKLTISLFFIIAGIVYASFGISKGHNTITCKYSGADYKETEDGGFEYTYYNITKTESIDHEVVDHDLECEMRNPNKKNG